MMTLSLQCLHLANGSSLDSMSSAFAGVSNFGIEDVSIHSAWNNTNVYENCNISVNAIAADTEENGRLSKSPFQPI